MSRESRRHHRKLKKIGTWKVVDDRSGFVLSSEEVVIDHQGRITSRRNFDPIHPSEMNIEVKDEPSININPRPIVEDE